MLLSGFYVNLSRLPYVVTFLQYLSCLKYGFTIAIINDVTNSDIHFEFPISKSPSEFVLDSLNMDVNIWQSFVCLGALIIGTHFLAFVFLKIFAVRTG